ncbi:hypothetical protein BO221_32385 [Archangium sp. Cb G35]|uniref:cadherin-like domain-containing protein n=1 Tax=Archangium sp. Cb G35 TaxID=1920190 RepID=UPI0009357213|nr:Ig-like domain-containing protein [Archangium sp. Cb G35]OJT19907.1 hypothetical protein BO221_32385 [Archangium sp. Cb G35]
MQIAHPWGFFPNIRVSILLVSVALAACGGKAPVAMSDSATTDEDTALEMTGAWLVHNDTGANGDSLTVTSVGAASHGTVVLAGDKVTFTPEADFSGTATFAYTVGDGRLTDTGTVSVTIRPVNDAPVAVADTVSTDKNAELVIPMATLLANDTDADGDALVVAGVGSATHGRVMLSGGNVTFLPQKNFTGTATFEYRVSDGPGLGTATVTVTVNPKNNAPVASGDAARTDEDTAVVIPTATLLANDTDAEGDILVVSAAGTATHGSVELAGGNVTFTPEADFFGTATFEYTVSDGTNTSTGKVTVTVNRVNDAPVASEDDASTDEDTVLVIPAATLLANDIDVEGDIFGVVGTVAAEHGRAWLADGNIIFTPEANFFGMAMFEYRVSDGVSTSTGKVIVTVNPVNDTPVAVADTASTDEDTLLVIPAATLLANDTDAEGDTLSVVEVARATHGTVELASGNVTFRPEADFFGTAAFEYRVSDGVSTNWYEKVTVTVNPVQDAPDAVFDSVFADEDVELRIPVAALLSNDRHGDGDPLSVSLVENARNGTVELEGDDVRFTPAPGFAGAAGFEYQVSDTHGATATASVAVIIRASGTKRVFVGMMHTCALFPDGRVKCWGANSRGELGLEDVGNRGDGPNEMGGFLPFVSLGTGQKVKTLALGLSSTCALLESGAVKCWGFNEDGQLGLGDRQNRGDNPGEMGDALPPVNLGSGWTARALAAGDLHTCAILGEGYVKCWGSNSFGQLGINDTRDRGDGPGEMGNELRMVNLGSGRTARALAAGDLHTCAILDDGTVKCWGANGTGQLGLGDTRDRGDGRGEMGDALPVVNLGAGRTAKALAAGGASTCALLDNGTVKCWGFNGFGQLGLGDMSLRGESPWEMGDMLPPVNLGTGRTAVALDMSNFHTCALLDDATVKCWGNGHSGSLGLGYFDTLGDDPGEMGDALPRINLGTGRTATSLTIGGNACATLDDGSVKCWGNNENGHLGLGDKAHRGDAPGEMGDALPAVAL